jgi:hypothetical protein
MSSGPYAWALWALLAIGTAARVGFVARPMLYDEAATYNEFASKPLAEGLSAYTFPNNHLLNTLLVHLSTAALGAQPWAIRLPALVAGVLLVPASYLMVRALCGRDPAIFTAALVASSEPLIGYSINARGYVFVCLVTVLLVLVAQRIKESGGRRWWDWVALAVLPAAGFYAIPIMLYPYGGVLLWLFLTSRPWRGRPAARVRVDRLIVAALVTVLLVGLLYAPVLLKSGLSSVVANRFVRPLPLDTVLRGLPASLAAAWRQWNLGLPSPLGWGGLVLAVTSAIWFARSGDRQGTAAGLFVTVVAWSLAVALVQRVVPFDRVWLFACPLYAACLGAGLAAVVERVGAGRMAVERAAPAVAVVLSLGLGALVVLGGALDREAREQSLSHADDIVRILKSELKDRDAIVATLPCDATLKYALQTHGVPADYLHDYRMVRASRLYVVVQRPAGQSVESVLGAIGVPRARFTVPRAVQDFGDSVLYELVLR